MKLGFIGMGNMALALCEGFITTGKRAPLDILAYAPNKQKRKQNASLLALMKTW